MGISSVLPLSLIHVGAFREASTGRHEKEPVSKITEGDGL